MIGKRVRLGEPGTAWLFLTPALVLLAGMLLYPVF